MAKLSPQLNSQLVRLGSDQTVRAIVLFELFETAANGARAPRRDHGSRQATMAAIRKAAEAGLAEIDLILHRAGGRRLAEEVSALGTVPIEARASVIREIADSEHVSAVLEDQPIARIAIPNP